MTIEKQKVTLITGGSSGIGLAISHELARKGYSLLLVSNQQDALILCKEKIERDFPVKCFAFFIDLTHPTASQQIFDFCIAENLEVEILVNNAGILIFSETVETPTERIQAVLQLHVYTPSILCRLFGNQMKHNRHGYILNVSSISSAMPFPGISIYGPSKTYIRYFTRALRSELKMFGVHVTCLIPGATATALYDHNKVNIDLAKRLGIMQNPEFVAIRAVDALFKNQAVCTPGMINKILMRIFPLIPSWFIMYLYRNTNWLKKGNDVLG